MQETFFFEILKNEKIEKVGNRSGIGPWIDGNSKKFLVFQKKFKKKIQKISGSGFKIVRT
jgi:hypothetical protein